MDRFARLFVFCGLLAAFVGMSSGCATLIGHSEPKVDTEVAAGTRLTIGEFADEVKAELGDDVEFVFAPQSLRERRLAGGWNGEGRLEVVLGGLCDAGVEISRDRLPNGRWRYTLYLSETAAPVVAAAPPTQHKPAPDTVTAGADTARVASKDGTANVGSSTRTEPTVAGGNVGGAARPSDSSAAPTPPAPPRPAPAHAAATRNIIRPGYLIHQPSGAENRSELDRRQTYQLNVADGNVDAGDALKYASDRVVADAEIRMVANGQSGFNFAVRPTNETVGEYGVLLNGTLYVRAVWAKQILGSDGPFWVGSDLLRDHGQWVWQQLREPDPANVTAP